MDYLKHDNKGRMLLYKLKEFADEVETGYDAEFARKVEEEVEMS